MSRQNALALYVPPKEFQTPFEGFMSALLARHARAARTMAGSAEWTDFPVEQAVADGLWAVMLRVAEKFGEPLATERQVVEKIAPRVNRVVNAGIIARYGMPEQAATAFMETVVASAVTRARRTPPGVISSLQTVWQEPAAVFFAELVRAARALREQIANHLRRLQEENEVRERPAVSYVSSIDLYAHLLGFLDIDGAWEEDPYRDAAALMGLERVLQHLKAKYRLLRFLRKLPLHLHEIPGDVNIGASTVDTQWIQTQILRAAAALPDGEYLTALEYGQGIQAMVATDDMMIIRRIVGRMTARGLVLGDEERRLFDGLIGERLSVLRRNPKTGVDPLTALTCYLSVRPEEFVMTEKDAVDIATGTAYDAGDVESMKGIGTLAYRAIRWEQLGMEDAERILNEGLLTPVQIAEGFSRMRPDRRALVVAKFMESGRMDADAIDVLLANGVFEPTPEFVLEHLVLLRQEGLEHSLRRLLVSVAEEKSIRWTKLPLAVISLTNRLGAEDVRRVYGDRGMRDGIQSLILDTLLDLDDLRENGITTEEFGAFRDRIGRELWGRYILCIEALCRESIYLKPDLDQDMAGASLLPWDRIAGATHPHTVTFSLPKTLGLTLAETEALVRAHTEEGLLRWFYEGRTGLTAIIKRFKSARERYYRERTGKSAHVKPRSIRRPSAKTATRRMKTTRRRKASSAPARKGVRKR